MHILNNANHVQQTPEPKEIASKKDKGKGKAQCIEVRIQVHILNNANRVWQTPEPKETAPKKDKQQVCFLCLILFCVSDYIL